MSADLTDRVNTLVRLAAARDALAGKYEEIARTYAAAAARLRDPSWGPGAQPVPYLHPAARPLEDELDEAVAEFLASGAAHGAPT